MKFKKNILKGLITLVLFLFFTAPALAQELSINYSFVQSQADQYSTQGLMEVTVFNQTTGDLRNVDLRLEQPAGSIENGVYQLGAIPSGEARVHLGDFLFPGDAISSGGAILFRVDYDNSIGIHSQITIPATRIDVGG